jgi:hypothetical protein
LRNFRGMSKRKPGRPRKVGRPRKGPSEPVDHRLTPKVAIAIRAIVEENLSRAEAAKVAGLTDDALRKSMRDNSAARTFYASEVKALMNFAKAKAVHTLIVELTGPNAAARVAASRILLEETDRTPAGNGMPAVPGFAILISDQRTQAMPVGPVLNQISRPPALLDASGIAHKD